MMSGPPSAIFLGGSHVELLGQAIFGIPSGSMERLSSNKSSRR